jgi:hypothetical protein
VPPFLRRAGAGTAPDGAFVVWSVAEGRRGRRWRESVRTGEGIRSSLLLELDPDGRFSHLELSTAAGLLTLHPEGDGTLHGNTVTAAGVHHVVGLAWDADGIVSVDGSSVAPVAALQRGFGDADGPDGRPGVHIGLDLALTPASWPRSARAGVVSTRTGTPFMEAGLPDLADGESWPLELD